MIFYSKVQLPLITSMLCSLGLVLSCASAPKQDSFNVDKFARSIQNKPTKLNMTKHYVLTDSADTEGFVCAHPSSKRWAVMLNSDDHRFAKDTVCTTDYLVQAFTQSDYNVIAVNMGHFFEGTGLTKDFSGPESRVRVKQLLEQAVTSLGLKQIEILWASGAASITAMFLSKDVPWFSELVIGNGIFEMDQFKPTISPYKEVLYAAKSSPQKNKAEGETGEKTDFAETRSIAWDASGIPKSAVIYHSKDNSVTPVESAKSFRDSLASEQLNVRFVPLEGANHLIDEKIHFSLLKALLLEK